LVTVGVTQPGGLGFGYLTTGRSISDSLIPHLITSLTYSTQKKKKKRKKPATLPHPSALPLKPIPLNNLPRKRQAVITRNRAVAPATIHREPVYTQEAPTVLRVVGGRHAACARARSVAFPAAAAAAAAGGAAGEARVHLFFAGRNLKRKKKKLKNLAIPKRNLDTILKRE
jgi:hypothetical protein